MSCGNGIIFKDMTSAEAKERAKELGYEETNYKSQNEKVFRRTKKSPKGSPKYITPDITGHNTSNG